MRRRFVTLVGSRLGEGKGDGDPDSNRIRGPIMQGRFRAFTLPARRHHHAPSQTDYTPTRGKGTRRMTRQEWLKQREALIERRVMRPSSGSSAWDRMSWPVRIAVLVFGALYFVALPIWTVLNAP